MGRENLKKKMEMSHFLGDQTMKLILLHNVKDTYVSSRKMVIDRYELPLFYLSGAAANCRRSNPAT